MREFQTDDVVNNRYRVVQMLGAGAMGSVFEVIDLAENGMRVALKVLASQADGPDVWAKGEYEALTRLRHPNLARVHNFGRIAGTRDYFLASEFIKGLDLYRATELSTLDEICELIVQICRALEYIHSQGYVHFDIKPENILVMRRRTVSFRDGSKVEWIPEDPNAEDESGVVETCVKVIDFGLAERITGSFDYAIKGTLHYLAPEIVQGGKPDARADLYSLGVTLYRIVNRELPSEGVALSRLAETRPRSRQEIMALCMRKAPDFLKAIILRLLEEKPENRFPSAKQVIQALNAGSGRHYELETPETQAAYFHASKLVGRSRELARLKELFRSVFRPDEVEPVPLPPASGPAPDPSPAAPSEEAAPADPTPLPAAEPAAEGGKPRTSLPSLVLVSGEIGSGKSRLVEEFEHFARLNDVQVFIGNCYESGSRAYGPFREILRPLVLALGRESQLCRTYGGAFARILPELDLHGTEAGPSSGDEPEKERLYFIDRIGRFLIEAGRTIPIIAVVNNVHWADEVSVELLAYVAELLGEEMARPAEERARILFAATCRTDESLPEGLRSLFDGLRDAGRLEDILLRRLKRSHLKELLGALLGMTEIPSRFVDALEEKTSGNPLYVVETLKALQEEGIIRHTNMGWQIAATVDVGRVDIPTTIESLVLRRFRNLEPLARTILEILAVFHQPVPPQRLARCPRLADVPVLVVIRDLEEKGLIQKSHESGGLTLSIAQPTFREIIYRHLDPASRARIHGDIVSLLEEEFAGREEEILEDLAFHACRGADPTLAVRYARAAGERLKGIHANEKAFEDFRFIGEILAGDEARETEWADAQQTLGEIATTMGRYDEAGACFASLSEEPRRSRLSIERVARAWRWRGRIAEIQGDYDAALHAYKEARNLLAGSHEASTAERILAANAIASLYVGLGQYAKAMEIALEALRWVEGSGETREHGGLFATIGRAHGEQGNLPQAIEFHKRSLEIRDGLGAVSETIGPLVGLGDAYREAGAYGEAIGFYGKARERSEAIGDPYGRAIALQEEAWVWLELGDSQRAESLAGAALRLEKTHRMRHLMARNHEIQGAILADRRQLSGAESYYIRALAAYSKQGNRHAIAAILLRIADVHRQRQEFGKARKAVLDAERHANELAAEPLRLGARIALARIVRADPEHPSEECLAILEDARAIASRAQNPQRLAEVLHELGETLASMRRIDAARDHYRQAAEKLQEAAEHLPDELRALFRERHADRMGRTDPTPQEVPDDETVAIDTETPERSRIRTLERENTILRSIVELTAQAAGGRLTGSGALRAAVEVTEAERGYLLVSGSSPGDVHVRSAVEADGRDIKRPSQRIAVEVVAEILASGEIMLVPSVIDDPRLNRRETVLKLGIQSLAVVPFWDDGKVRGLIYLENAGLLRIPAPRLGSICEALAALAGWAVRNPERSPARA
ncbi:MAG: protein kinase [Planctomycetes bacterium]|nr:protein kinase [Planctomycetota bacterium]